MAVSRKGSWSNSDGLVVGFGSRYPERQATAAKNTDGGAHELTMDFTFESTTGAGNGLSIPAGFVVADVYLVVGTAWVGGTSLSVGDTDVDGWITATAAATANLTAGAIINMDGAYAIGDAATNRGLPKAYATADTLDIAVTGTYTAGSARLVVKGFIETAAAV